MLQSNIIMYTTEDGITKVEVTFDQDTVWLSMNPTNFSPCNLLSTNR